MASADPRPASPPGASLSADRLAVALIGQGRLGQALARALAGSAGFAVLGPLGRGADGAGADVVLLCVPDQEIAAAARAIQPGPLVGHCSGATGLEPLRGHEAFSLHPLMTVTTEGAELAGAGAAVAGSTPRALALAGRLALALGMNPVEVADSDRAAYHAAASMASNFLITLEAAAERLAAQAGLDRRLLAPLVRATIENWDRLGAQRALTGPVARGDEATVARQREAVRDRAPELLALFDAMAAATRTLAGRGPGLGREPEMRTIRTVAELRAALADHRAAGRSIGLVPTMGALHEGHLALMRRARRECDVVVMSLFVNPAQFNEARDLEAYPRDLERDTRLAAQAGVDYLFAPGAQEIYPAGFSTTVSVSGLTETLEGAHRGREHFDGVATVVTKLLNIVGPHIAYFGQKDAQQALVIKRLVADLDMPVQIEVCATVREPDGLAASSRNVRLSAPERARALALPRALALVRRAVQSGERDAATVRTEALNELHRAGVEPEYLELVAPATLEPVNRVEGPVLAVVAGWVGATRLIDNEIIEPPPASAAGDPERRT